MARPLRIAYPGAFYHITSQGNERKAIFRHQRDREKVLSYKAGKQTEFVESVNLTLGVVPKAGVEYAWH
jgi:hypothetical protein